VKNNSKDPADEKSTKWTQLARVWISAE